MPGLSPARILTDVTEGPAHEMRGLAEALAQIEDRNPFCAWPTVCIYDRTRGRLYEIDLLILGSHALYVVELKDYRGTLYGDRLEWRIESEGRALWRQGPLSLTDLKAKILKSELGAAFKDLRVEPLILLTHPDLVVRLAPEGEQRVVTLSGFKAAIEEGDYPGTALRGPLQRVDAPLMRRLKQRLKELGLRKAQATLHMHGHKLGRILHETEAFQDFLAEHEQLRGRVARARVYPLSHILAPEVRGRLERQARREADRIQSLPPHPNLLPLENFDPGNTGELRLGPTLLYSWQKDATSLHEWLHAHKDAPLDVRASLIQQISEGLQHCHDHDLQHRALDPDCIAIFPEATGPRAKIFGFQGAITGSGATSDAGTLVHPSRLASFRAPELLLDPTSATRQSDVFSLGAIAYWVLTGRPPALTTSEARDRLATEHCYRPSFHRPDLQALDEVFKSATHENRNERKDSPREWCFELMNALQPKTEPLQIRLPTEAHDPLTAKAGERLGPFEVLHLLGTGATARVLAVRDEDGEYALKIPLDPGQEDLLREEGRALERLGAPGHPGIVRLLDRPILNGRFCLLLSLCSRKTLADRLREEGTIALDLAARWGTDLLQAVAGLERTGISHKDIKPANLGFPPEKAKQADHLILYDFSLTSIDAHRIEAGTRAWRDPFLFRRGAWDAAADRFAVAAVLYEMLTGRTPELENPDLHPKDPAARILIEQHLFDPRPRESLHAFFERAFASEVSQRFQDAASMSTAFREACEGSEPRPRTDALPKNLNLRTPLANLSVSAKALNVLDRAGLEAVGDLFELPANTLSAVRGCGRSTREEIQRLRERLQDALQTKTLVPKKPFVPNFHLPPRPLDLLPGILGPIGLVRLTDGGLASTAQLASADKGRISRLLRESDTTPDALAHWLQSLLAEASARGLPPTLTACAIELFGLDQPKKKLSAMLAHARAAVGYGCGHAVLDQHNQWANAEDLPPRLAPRNADIAKAFGVASPSISVARRKRAERWASLSFFKDLQTKAEEALHALGGLSPLDRLAEQLLLEFPPTSDDPKPRRRAAAILRALAQIKLFGLARLEGLSFQAHLQRDWVATSDALLGLLPKLHRGTLEVLRATTPAIVSIGRLRTALQPILSGTPLATKDDHTLSRLARDAAGEDAVGLNARFELFDLALSAQAARDSIAPGLGDRVPLAQFRASLEARFPRLLALREQDGLLSPQALADHLRQNRYQPSAEAPDVFELPSDPAPQSSATQGAGKTRGGLQSLPPQSPEAKTSMGFERSLRLLLEQGQFRVLTARVALAPLATDRLIRRINGLPCSLSRRLIQEMDAVLTQKRGQPQKLRELDALGLGGKSFDRVCAIARDAALALHPKIVAEQSAPLFLTEPGLYARYGLIPELAELLSALHDRSGPASFLMLPVQDHHAPILAPGLDCPLPGTHELLLETPDAWIESPSASASPLS